MIYIISDKFFRKKAKKLVSPKQYFIIDANNYMSTGTGDADKAISTKYKNSHTVGNLCPETYLMSLLRKLSAGQKVKQSKLDAHIDDYINDKIFIGGVCATLKAYIALGASEELNVFVVFPTLVYKYLRKPIIKRFRKLTKVEKGQLFFTQETIEDDWSILKKETSSDMKKMVIKRTKKIDEKYQLQYMEED